MTNISKIEQILGAKPIEPVREQINGKRHYIVREIQEAPMVSVTSVISDVVSKPALVNWGKNLGISAGLETLKGYVGTYITENILDEFKDDAKVKLAELSTSAADYGTKAHSLIEAIINGENPEIPMEFNPVIEGFRNWQEKNDINLILSEMCVYSINLQVAGTLDALGTKGDKIILFDWKTSNGFYEEMALQCGGYVCCLEEMTGQAIDEGWIV
ncbi:uncharacterized protein METZ01_LOCUS240742, partial [marine metagenome]